MYGKRPATAQQLPQQQIQKLLTPEQVAAMLGVPRLFIIRQSRAGKIPALKLGKCYRYRPESIQARLDEQESA